MPDSGPSRQQPTPALVPPDPLELEIVGDWGDDSRARFDLQPHGATEDQQQVAWTYNTLPQTNLVAHVPGI